MGHQGKFDVLSMWWKDTNQHRGQGLESWLRKMRTKGCSYGEIADDMNARFTSKKVSVSKTTIHRWWKDIDHGKTPV